MHSPTQTACGRPFNDSATHAAATSQLLLAAAAVGGVALLASRVVGKPRPRIDTVVRASIRRHVSPGTRSALAPLFPIGLPGVCIPAAHVLALALARRRRAGGPAIIAAAWLGWFVHRAVKLRLHRERPRQPAVRRRRDSFPSGHTTDFTALTVTSAIVLHRRHLISPRAAAALGLGAPLVMGVYRVVDDEHWATDVFGGWLAGTAIALSCTAMLGDAGPLLLRGRRSKVAGPAARG